MFDDDLSALATADLLESAAAHRAEANRVEGLLEHAQIFADRNHPSVCPTRPSRLPWEGRERGVVLGGDGCPEIAEFAPAEFGFMLGISAGAAAAYIGQALALRHRFPFIWAKVQAGEATPWRAAKIAAACVELPAEAAASVDRRLAPIVDSVTPYRLDKIVKAAAWHADPAGARAAAEEKARERGVYVGHSDDHGTKTIYVRAASGDVIRFDATVASIADALRTLGDTSSLPSRRAKAIGIIADPHYTAELLLQVRNHHPSPTPTSERAQFPTTTSSPNTAPAQDAKLDADATPPDPNTALARAAELDTNAALAGSTSALAPTPSPGADVGSARDEAGAAGRVRTHLPESAPGSASTRRGDLRARRESEVGEERLLQDSTEPSPLDEADRDAPHPSVTDLPDPLDLPSKAPVDPNWPGPHPDREVDVPLDPTAQRALDARLAQIKSDAYTRQRPHTAGADRPRPRQTQIYVHLTDHTLASGDGILRVERLGPLLAAQLSELVGHGPYTVKPVIDLNDAVSVDAYEIPTRIRERVKLTHPVELFPFGTRETDHTIDLDHIQPYERSGPPGQTSVENLAPLRRFSHRVKTHGHGWRARRVDHKTIEWRTPNGFTFRVDPTGTHRVDDPGGLADSS